MTRVDDAKTILKALGMPRPQTNDNAAYTLLAFANVGPRTPWSKATAPRLRPHDVTEVWVAEFPTHMLHYNGDRFLGPR